MIKRGCRQCKIKGKCPYKHYDREAYRFQPLSMTNKIKMVI
jgi:hypothetical protein